MELKVINEQGQEAAKLQASDELFGRDYNESLIHQVVVAYQANARTGDRKAKGRSEIAKSTKKAVEPEGYGSCSCRSRIFAVVARRRQDFPNTPDENFSQKLNRKMYRAGMAAILSELARQDRLSVVDSVAVEAPKTKLFAQKIKGMGFDSVLVVTADLDENLLSGFAQPAERAGARSQRSGPGLAHPLPESVDDQGRDRQV